MYKKKSIKTMDLIVIIMLFPTQLLSAKPIIHEISSTGGHPVNKDNPKDRMYLVKVGDKITFTVKAEGAEKYVWQVNKVVQKNVRANTFTWTVPDEKDIWEIHVVAKDSKGNQAHQEWVISTLTKAEAPDFFEYFVDKKWAQRSESDPWGRPLPNWKAEKPPAPVTSSAWLEPPGSVGGPGNGTVLKTQLSAEFEHGTIRFRYRFPIGGGWPPCPFLDLWMGGNRGNLWYRIAADTHHYFQLLPPQPRMDYDVGFTPDDKWHEVTIILRDDGWIYTFIDEILDFKYRVEAGKFRKIWWRLHREGKRRPHGRAYVPANYTTYVDCLSIFSDRYLFPQKKGAIYGDYIANYYCKDSVFIPVRRKGVVVSGRGNTLESVARAINNPTLFIYDRDKKTAICYTNLALRPGAQLVLTGEVLKIHSEKDGEHEIALGYGAELEMRNSTITSNTAHFFNWRIASGGTQYGYPLAQCTKLSYASHITFVAENSTIDNCSHLLFDSPMVLRLKNVNLANLHETDLGDYRFEGSYQSALRGRREFYRGLKSLWIFTKEFPTKTPTTFEFDISNVTIRGHRSPLHITLLLNAKLPRVNLYDVDAHGENIVVRTSLKLPFPIHAGGFWGPSNYAKSYVGLVNCRFKRIMFPPEPEYYGSSRKAEDAVVAVKYYLDVKGPPGAKVTVKNDVDDVNFPAENRLEVRPPEDKGYYYLISTYSTSRVTRITSSGHTPLPTDKKGVIILTDFVQDKNGKKEMTYTITVEKDGRKKTITAINPGPHWYRPDPNVPTYTITAVLDGKTETEADLKKKGLAGSPKRE